MSARTAEWPTCECCHPKYVHSRDKKGKYSGGCAECGCPKTRSEG